MGLQSGTCQYLLQSKGNNSSWLALIQPCSALCMTACQFLQLIYSENQVYRKMIEIICQMDAYHIKEHLKDLFCLDWVNKG